MSEPKISKKLSEAMVSDENPPSIGPLTDATLSGAMPTPIEQEWRDALKDRHGYVLVWAGAYRGPDESDDVLHWSWLQASLADDAEIAEADELATTLSPEAASRTERLLSPLSHETRIRIMQSLWRGPHTSGGLSEATGLTGGNLYYHLRELMHAGYVADDVEGYALTALGRQLLVTLTLIASQVVGDKPDAGALVRTVWTNGTSP